MSANVLADRDVNAPAQQMPAQKGDVKSMEYHRQMLQEKIADGGAQQSYVSPSDNIMSPCTAKLSAYRNKHVLKAKPKSLFAKTQSKNLGAGGMFGEKSMSDDSSDANSLEGQ